MGPKKGKGKGLGKKAKKALKLLLQRTQAHDALEREIKYGRRTYSMHEKKWREMMLKVALPKMKDDLLYAWQSFERALDCKDFKISLLMDDLAIAEEQHMMKNKNNIEDIDNLIKDFHNQIEDMATSFNKHLEQIREEARQLDETILASSHEDENFLKIILYGLEQVRKYNEKNIRGELVTKLNDDRNKYREMVGTKSYALENMFEEMFNDIGNYVQKYFVNTEERRMQYTKLYIQDTNNRRLNADLFKRILRMQEVIKRLKIKYTERQEIKILRISDLKAERQFYADNYTELTRMMHRIMRVANKNLHHLVVISYETMAYLAKLLEKGEKILKIMMVCSKEQTLQECLRPFPLFQPCEITDTEKIVVQREPEIMDSFWMKVAKVDADRVSLIREKNQLIKQNRLIKEKILKYCRCIECPGLPPIYKNRDSKMNVIVANEVMRNYSFFATNA